MNELIWVGNTLYPRWYVILQVSKAAILLLAAIASIVLIIRLMGRTK